MNWEQYQKVMERFAIKIDDMATDDAYFMATHMPFSQLEMYEGGRTSTTPTLKTEDEIFDELVYNPNNENRFVIVRGDNGAGKTHLIRYLQAKFKSSPTTVYNPQTEHLLFLRRLNNSIRGAFSQLIDQKVIRDPAVEEKLKKFIDSSDSKDEASFKNEILYAYIAAVSNDVSSKTYKPVICRNIASYLSDSRVKDHLLREGGAIARCYNVITAPSNQVLKSSSIFTDEDFNVARILRAVIRQGDPQASDFATTLKGDESEITTLVNYLNHFTREVVQRCADISSESTKSVFTQLRKDLKAQGKNLTIFIEDFTGFTGIDSELITVLSTEHDGVNADLCRVTAIIGITNDYYDQFRDNFTDRVTHQVSVTDRSFGTNAFLVQMAGRYLNAIYCDPDSIHDWYKTGGKIEDLPISNFRPPCDWESIKIGDHTATLYPFNSSALLTLYDKLPVKSPRMFLREVLRSQLKEYFDGKIFNDEWFFPLNPSNTQMAQDQHSSYIDRLTTLSPEDKKRLKAVLAIWGDGSANAIRSSDGSIYIGGLNLEFLKDINLGQFSGIGLQSATPSPAHHAVSPAESSSTASIQSTAPTQSTEQKKPQIDGATRDYLRFKDDITAWFTEGADLKYHADYRKLLQIFICGDLKQCGAINWQDIGVPAFIAYERLSDIGYYFIEGQDSAADSTKALVYMNRGVESRDALRALIELKYARGWDFEGSQYYQQRLITWLERNRKSIIQNVAVSINYENQPPVLEWCLALQYLRAMILGHPINTSSPLTTAESLFQPFTKDTSIKRETKEWNELIQFVENKKADFDSALIMLKKSSATTMGAIAGSSNNVDKQFYRTNELIIAAEKLIKHNWDIEKELPTDMPDRNLLFNSAKLLKALYPRIRSAMAAEKDQINSVIVKLKEFIGDINQENLLDTLSAIQEMFSVFGENGIWGHTELRSRYEGAPIELTSKLLQQLRELTEAAQLPPVAQLTQYSQNGLNFITDFLRDMQRIAQIAEKEEAIARKELEKLGGFSGLDDLCDAARSEMIKLCDQLEDMEVYNATN